MENIIEQEKMAEIEKERNRGKKYFVSTINEKYKDGSQV